MLIGRRDEPVLGAQSVHKVLITAEVGIGQGSPDLRVSDYRDFCEDIWGGWDCRWLVATVEEISTSFQGRRAIGRRQLPRVRAT